MLGRFEVLAEIGRGAMGIVYKAKDPMLERIVAIKTINMGMDRDGAEMYEKRFYQEARAAGGLNHPNIVTVYDIGEQDDVSYIAMEFVHGESLESVLRAGRTLSFKEIGDLVTQLCRALDFAHDHGVIHRDIKPANVLLTPDGRPKIVDFGVAKLSAALGGEETRLTQVGAVIGTPAYMSPEQVTGHEVTARSDQFSLGVVVYEMLAGEVPFQGSGATTVMYKIVHEQPAKLKSFDKRLPGKIDDAVLRALAKNPEDRYERCEELARAVRAALQSAPDEIDATADSGAAATVVLEPESAGTVVLEPVAGGATLIATPGEPAPAVARAAEATTRRAPRLRQLVMAIAAVVVIAVGGMVLLSPDPNTQVLGTSGDVATEAPAISPPSPPPGAASTTGAAEQAEGASTAPAEPLAAAAEASWWLSVNPYPASAAIFVDGQDSGRMSPAEIQLVGRTGDVVRVELRRDGSTVAAGDIELGPFMPKEWPVDSLPDVAAPSVGDGLFARRIEIRSRPRGAAILIDGRDTGERTPATLALEGRIGDRFRVTVVDGSRELGNRTLVLGPNLAAVWDVDEPLPAAEASVTAVAPPGSDAESQLLRITSRPEGATVILDEERLGGGTPVEVRLDGGRRHQLRVELPGYRTASWAFTLDDLNDAQRRSGELHFPLVADAPPGRLRASAPGYEVSLVVNGRRYNASSSIDLELPAGEYTVQIEAPEVFLSTTRTLRIASNASIDLPLPAAIEVQIAATPGNCRVSIDGRFVDVTPFRARLVAGEHDIEFFWPTLGRTVRRSERVTRADQRIFASAEGAQQ